MKKILVGNWKMNPSSLPEAINLINEIKKRQSGVKGVDIVVCPPFVFLNEIGALLKGQKKIKLGSQDAFGGNGTSFTGEVSVDMIKNAGAEYAIIGHSERREMYETLQIVSEKIIFSLKGGLKVILCVGEEQRDEHGDFYNYVKDELELALSKINKKNISKLIIAYEPTWAIGKKENEILSPENLHEMVIFIRKVLTDKFGEKGRVVPILYGGSVSKNNAQDIISKGNIDGLLIGRESLKPENFAEVAEMLGSR